MRILRYSFPVVLLLASALRADVEVALQGIEPADGKALVKFSIKNTFNQPIKDARVWVFLMDADEKVVGNHAQWIVGGKDAGKAEGGGRIEPGSPPPATGGDTLEPQVEKAFAVSVDAQRTPTQARITLSRIILADGTHVQPQTHVTGKKD